LEIRFTWNEEKARLNLLNHGVSFESAKEVFQDPNQVVSENYFKDGEQRLQIIGMTRNAALLLVVFVDHSNPDIEIIHIISARKGEAIEEQAYEEQIG
jgi:uncharacterized DUF497 family protein